MVVTMIYRIIDGILDIQLVGLVAVASLAVLARIFAFCYWWVIGSWEDERCEAAGGHDYDVVVTEKSDASVPQAKA
jgi:hypothetical protein